MRELPGPPGGGRDPHRAEPVHRPGQRGAAARPPVLPDHLGELPADPLGGVERGRRILEDHSEREAQQPAPRGRVAGQQRHTEELQPPRVDPTGLLDELGDRQRGQALAGPGLADQAHRLTATHGEADLADRADLPEAHPQALDGEQMVTGGDGRRRFGARRSTAAAGRRAARPDRAGERLAEEVERQTRHDDRDGGGEGRGRAYVDAGQALAEQPAPVVPGRLYAEAEEGEPGERQQRAAGRHGAVDQQRFGDVGQDVPGEHAYPAQAGDPRGVHVVLFRDTRRERVGQSGEARCDREADRQHRTLETDSEDDREEERQQQAGEGHRDVQRGSRPAAEAGAQQQRRHPERQAGGQTDQRGQQRQQHRQPGGDEYPGEDVPTEAVGAGPVRARGALEDPAGVDRLGPVGPERGREQREQDDTDQQRRRGDGHRGPQDPSCRH
ncbi:hypothetical protein GCM10027615_60750 [Plantactinospora veratri]